MLVVTAGDDSIHRDDDIVAMRPGGRGRRSVLLGACWWPSVDAEEAVELLGAPQGRLRRRAEVRRQELPGLALL